MKLYVFISLCHKAFALRRFFFLTLYYRLPKKKEVVAEQVNTAVNGQTK
jgi:hypothetical protein